MKVFCGVILVCSFVLASCGQEQPTGGDEALSSSESALASYIGKTRFGVDAGGIKASEITNQANAAAAVHAKNIRLWLTVRNYYPSGNKSPDWYQDNINQTKIRIDAYAAKGFRITLTVSGTDCRNLAECMASPKTLSTKRSDGSFETDFDRYMKKLIADLGPSFDKLSAIEIWNEWNWYYGHKSGSGYVSWSAGDFVEKILHGGYKVVKDHNANIEVVAGSVVVHKVADLDGFVKAGGGNYADAIGYHPYSATADQLNGHLADAEKLIASTKKPLFLSEWGCLNCNSTQMQALLKDGFDVVASHNVEEADWYVLAGDSNSSAMLKTDGKSQNALYGIYKNAIEDYEDASTPVTVPPKDDPGLIAAKGNTNLCLNVWGNSSANGSVLKLYTCQTSAKNELFTLDQHLEVFNPSKCVSTSGSNAYIWDCSTDTKQNWSKVLVDGTSYQLKNSKYGTCLEVPDSNLSSGTELKLAACNSGLSRQLFVDK